MLDLLDLLKSGRELSVCLAIDLVVQARVLDKVVLAILSDRGIDGGRQSRRRRHIYAGAKVEETCLLCLGADAEVDGALANSLDSWRSSIIAPVHLEDLISNGNSLAHWVGGVDCRSREGEEGEEREVHCKRVSAAKERERVRVGRRVSRESKVEGSRNPARTGL